MANKSNLIKDSKGDIIFSVCAKFVLFLIMLTIIYPLWFVIVASFSDTTLIYTKPFLFWPLGFNLESYKLVFEDKDIISGFLNSVFYTVLGTTINVAATICTAYPLSRRKFKGKGFITFILTFTMFFGGGLIPTYILLDNLKMLNTIWVLVIPGAVSMFNVIVMRTYFQTSIPYEIEEAAKVDGCTNFRLLIKIILPLSIPIIAVIGLYYGVGHWNSYFSAMIYINDRKLYPLQLILREILIQNQMSEMMDIVADSDYSSRMMARMGLKYAVIIISAVPIFVVYPMIQKFFAKGVMVGSIKG